MLDELIERHMATRWDTGWSSYGYDLENRLSQWQYKTTSTSEHTETYHYAVKDPEEETDEESGESTNEDSGESTVYVPIGSLKEMGMNSGDSLHYEYDALDRLTDRHIKYTGNNDWQLWDRYTFASESSQITRKKVWIRGEGSRGFHYTYDGNGNILKQNTYLKDENEQNLSHSTVTYNYDSANQLLGAVHSGGRTESYSYDNTGNLLTFNNGTISHSYTYGDSQWGDLLTAVDGQPIQYDAIGNPTSYYDGYRYTFTWEQGRQLKSSTCNNWTTNYRYNEDGLRTEKYWADGSSVKYDIVDGRTVGETHYNAGGNPTLYMRYIFDESGSVTGIGLWYSGNEHWTDYYFVKNLQGDVVEVYDTNNTLAASYTYDAWGNILTKSGDLADINPFRYRTYYFDNETWFYYLQSRYYDPAIGRFINADVLYSTGQGLLGNNMFTYCLNNPVNCADSIGFMAYYANDPAGELGRMIGGWIADVIKTDENEKDEHGNLTIKAKAKRLGKAVYKNLDCSAGVGMGFELSADIADVIAVGIGMHVDMFAVHLNEGEFSYGQDYSAGVSVTAFYHNVGFVETGYNKYFEYGESEISKGFWGDETLTIAAGSAYFGLGGSFRIGFDIAQFFRDLNLMFA